MSVSSDAYGSWPVFDARGELVSYEVRAGAALGRARGRPGASGLCAGAGKASPLEAGAGGASAAC